MKLFFHSYGSGPVLIILHGLFGWSDNWVTLGKRFASTFRVLIPDLRNHGRSPRSQLFDLPSLEEDLLELLEEVPGPVMLIGHSLGGRVAIRAALHHPRLIRRLVVVDISLRRYPPGKEHLYLIGVMQSLDLSRIRSRTEAGEALQTRVPDLRLRQFLLKNLYWDEQGALAWRLNLPVLAERLPALFDGEEVTGVYPGPALFIRGGNSGYVTDSDLPAIQRQFPGSIVRTVAGASHWVHADAPGEFFTEVSAFLGA